MRRPSLEHFRACQNLRFDGDQLGATVLRQHLDIAGALEGKHHQERVGDGRAAGQQTVVVQHQEIVFAEVGLQSRFLFMVKRNTFVGVISQAGQDKQ